MNCELAFSKNKFVSDCLLNEWLINMMWVAKSHILSSMRSDSEYKKKIPIS